MEEVKLTIEDNEKILDDVYLLTLKGDLKAIKNPGEFVEIKLDKHFLRRPISVYDYNEFELKLLYKILGQGTLEMSYFKKGMTLDILVGLGNGFTDLKSTKPLLIAGGIGVAPMYALAKSFNQKGIKPKLILGLRSEKELKLGDLFKEVADVIITTDDGSYGFKGNPVSYLKENNLDFDKYYACGPQVMLKFLKEFNPNGYLSLEARMGCGFGACMGCSIKTTKGFKRVCKEGPIFEALEVIFDEN